MDKSHYELPHSKAQTYIGPVIAVAGEAIQRTTPAPQTMSGPDYRVTIITRSVFPNDLYKKEERKP